MWDEGKDIKRIFHSEDAVYFGHSNGYVILTAIQRFKKVMRATQGALIVASTLQIVLGFSGLWRNVVRLVDHLFLINHTYGLLVLFLW